ncbi:MAG: hypothetical protein O3B31_14215 [Chloroflexi bacterium]|nr:hypothetical protein [Chloroflexota bacterium]
MVAAVAFVPITIGAPLPRRHRATRHIRLAHARVESWSRIADIEAQPG